MLSTFYEVATNTEWDNRPIFFTLYKVATPTNETNAGILDK